MYEKTQPLSRRARRALARESGMRFQPIQQEPQFASWTNPVNGVTNTVRTNGFFSEVPAQIAKYRARLPLRSIKRATSV